MKEEYKSKLKKIYHVGCAAAFALLLLISIIGVSAYAVYWISKNSENDTQEVSKSNLAPRSLDYYSDTYQLPVTYQAKSQAEYGYHYYHETESLSADHYYDYWFSVTHPSFSTTQFIIDIVGNIYAGGGHVVGNSIRVYLNYTLDTDLNVYYISFNRVSILNNDLETFVMYDTTPTYNYCSFTINEIISYSHNSDIVETYDYSLLDFCFTSIFNPNYQELVSYSLGYTGYNPNFYLSSNVYDMNVLRISPLDDPSDYLGHYSLYFNDIVFNSNGLTFKGIKFNYDSVYSYRYAGTYGTFSDYGYLTCVSIEYWVYGTIDTWIKVATMEETINPNTTHTHPCYVLDGGYNWLDDRYQTIIFDKVYLSKVLFTSPFLGGNEDFSNPLYNLTFEEILTFKGYYVDTGYLPGDTDIGLYNVFNLLSYAFSSLIPILSISLLPGISIGLLVFLPLVVTIIIVIVRLVRK